MSKEKELSKEKILPVAFAAICVLAAFFPIVSLSGGEVNVWMNISHLGGLAYLIAIIVATLLGVSIASIYVEIAYTGFWYRALCIAGSVLLLFEFYRGASQIKMLAGFSEGEIQGLSVLPGAGFIGMLIGFVGILISVSMKKKEPVAVHVEQTNP